LPEGRSVSPGSSRQFQIPQVGGFASDDENAGRVGEAGGDKRAGLLRDVAVNDEKKLAVPSDDEGFRGSHCGLLRLVLELENSHHWRMQGNQICGSDFIIPATVAGLTVSGLGSICQHELVGFDAVRVVGFCSSALTAFVIPCTP
jgi:hypothetical protein